MFLLNRNNEKVLTVVPFSDNAITALFERPNFYGIFFFTKAEGVVVIDQQQVEVEGHNVLFYYPYQQLSLKGDIEGIFVQFHPDFFCIDIHAKDIGCQGLLFNNFFNDFLLKCSAKEFKKLFAFCSVLEKELRKNNIGQLDMVASQLKIFLIHAVRFKLEKQEEELPFKDELHYRIEKLIETNFASESSPDFYAEKLEVSLTKFNRLCQKYFQNSFVTILTLKKVATAKNKLFLTNLSIKDIAYAIGFNDPLYFSRVFRKYCGVSPKEFRTQLKTNRLI